MKVTGYTLIMLKCSNYFEVQTSVLHRELQSTEDQGKKQVVKH